MSIEVEGFRVYCDNRHSNDPECDFSCDMPGMSRREAVENAEAAGWLILARKHYCPLCRNLPRKRKR